MSIREEFLKALYEAHGPATNGVEKDIAVWAARWAMERCADEAGKEENCVLDGKDGQDLVRLRVRGKIRQLAKGLDEPLE